MQRISVPWKRLLMHMYKYYPLEIPRFKQPRAYPDHAYDKLAKQLGLHPSFLMGALVYLEDHGLIEYQLENAQVQYAAESPKVEETYRSYTITEKGFNVALNLENQEAQNKLQSGMLVLTGLLVFNGAVDVIKKIELPSTSLHALLTSPDLYLLIIYASVFLWMAIISFHRIRIG